MAEIWTHIRLQHESRERMPIRDLYAGQGPLLPWLIRIFQNWNISQMRRAVVRSTASLDLNTAHIQQSTAYRAQRGELRERWHQLFAEAAERWIDKLTEEELL